MAYGWRKRWSGLEKWWNQDAGSYKHGSQMKWISGNLEVEITNMIPLDGIHKH